jgi:quercetin dioxygenase-like cupin family protein
MKVAVTLVAAAALFAQTKRMVIYTGDVSVPGREAVITHIEVPAGASTGRVTHPGDEMSYVAEGEADLLVEGKPDRQLKAGDGFVVPANIKHDVHNTGTQAFKLIAVFLLEKGKPLVTR